MWNKLKEKLNAENIKTKKPVRQKYEVEEWSPTSIKLPPICTDAQLQMGNYTYTKNQGLMQSVKRIKVIIRATFTA